MTAKSANRDGKKPPWTARVNEPRVPGCNSRQSWEVRLGRRQDAKAVRIEIRFYKRSGELSSLAIDAARRTQFEYVRRQLDAHDARLPADRDTALEFIRSLMASAPTTAYTVIDSPGFYGPDIFAAPGRVIGPEPREYVWDLEKKPAAEEWIHGTLDDYKNQVLSPAMWSPYASLVILIGLSASLLEYVRLRRGRKLLTETAVVHFSQESSAGKTTIARIAQSVCGAPDGMHSFDASDRAVAEAAHSRNGMVLVLDDTESDAASDADVFFRLQKLGQHVPRGHSRAISAKTGQSTLRWCCFAVTTGPDTLRSLASRLGHPMRGGAVRILDIRLPDRGVGGLFGSNVVPQGKKPSSRRLISTIEAGLERSWGVLFDAWIEALLDHDVSNDACRYFDRFVEAFGAYDALEARFASKFALPYAAGRIAVDLGLLPWPASWVRSAVEHCLVNSCAQRELDTSQEMQFIARLADETDKFPRVEWQRGRLPRWADNQIGVCIVGGKYAGTWLSADRMDAVYGQESFGVRNSLIRRMKRLGFISRPRLEGTGAIQFRVGDSDREDAKLRLWSLDVAALTKWSRNVGRYWVAQ